LVPRIRVDAGGGLRFPPELGGRYRLRTGEELLLEETEAGLVLHPLRPDVRKLYLEVTTRCNLQCRMCVRNVWGEPLEDMAPTTFDRVVAQLQGLPELCEVVLGSHGEPLAHPHILDHLAAIKRPGLKVSISTNGTLLDEERAEALVQLGIDVVTVSLDGTDPDTYAGVRQGADLRAVIDNLEALNRIRARQKTLLPRLGIEFVAMKQNVAELSNLPELAQRLGADRVLVTHVLPHTPEMAAETLYGRNETPSFPVPAGWPVRCGDWLLWGIMELPRMNWGAERRCRFMADKALVVGWDGGVSPCYALFHSYPYYVFGRRKEVSRYTFGNVNRSTLAEIWTSDEYVRFRAEVRRFNFPSCVDCDLRDTCDITAANDSCWGWCPSCADCLWAQGIVRCP